MHKRQPNQTAIQREALSPFIFYLSSDLPVKIFIHVEEQLPLSSEERIKVKMIEPSERTLAEEKALSSPF